MSNDMECNQQEWCIDENLGCEGPKYNNKMMFRYHNSTVPLAPNDWVTLQFPPQKNEGLCRKTGKIFGEVMDYFIIGGYKTCILDNSIEDVRVIGTKDVKKHDKDVDDRRGYITLYRTVNTDGSTGPNVFLLASNIPRRDFNCKFLIKYGADLGPLIIMMEIYYMKYKAWEYMTPKLMEGYRNLTIIRENPQWWFADITDRFGGHHSSFKAPEISSYIKYVAVK